PPHGRILSTCFFFQAEDGIRDFHVTGVQTCALPISGTASPLRGKQRRAGAHRPQWGAAAAQFRPSGRPRRSDDRRARQSRRAPRSEERRVGKECRCRRWRCQKKKKGKTKNDTTNTTM